MKKKTAADYLKGPGLQGGVYSPRDIIEAEYGSVENFHQCEFVDNAELIHALTSAGNIKQRWNAIREYYAYNQPKIDRARYDQWAIAYDFPIHDYFSPIERDCWAALRYDSVVMYPQYPALNYFLDFANPKLKIAIEMDGKRWHQQEKDAVRDRALMKKGWTIYRIAGRECYTKAQDIGAIYDKINTEEYRYWEDDCAQRKEISNELRDFYMNTVDGVVRAIKYTYFKDVECPDIERRYVDETLRVHRAR